MSYWISQATDVNYACTGQDSQWPQLQSEQCTPFYDEPEYQDTQCSYVENHPTFMTDTPSAVDPVQLGWRMTSPLSQSQQYPVYNANSQSPSNDMPPYNFDSHGTLPYPNQDSYADPNSLFETDTMSSSQPDPPSDDPGQDEPYNKLLGKCLSSNPYYEMELKDIYRWFRDNTQKRHHPEHTKWKNSIRHNLSLNAAFEKGSRSNPQNPKKHMWYLTDEALQNGIKSTTTYRKNARKVQKKETSRRPALLRQIAGARGGRAASRAAARNRSVIFPRSRSRRLSGAPSAILSPYSRHAAFSPNLHPLDSFRDSTSQTCPPLVDAQSMMSSPLPGQYNGSEFAPPIDPTLTNSHLTSNPENYFAEVFESEVIKDDFHAGVEFCSAPTSFGGYQLFQ